MKILIVRTFPSILDPDGYNIQETGFAKALVRAGHTCDVVLYNGRNKDEIREVETSVDGETKKIKVYMRHGLGILKNGFFPGLRKIAENYDLIQVHEYDQITSWMYYAFYKKKPVVIYHGPYYDAFNKGYNLKCGVFDNTFLLNKNRPDTLCFTKSNASAEFLRGKGFRDVVPIGVGLDTDNFTVSCGDKYELKKDSWNMLYVGKIEDRRNPYMLLQILEKVHEKCNDVHLTIVGSGEKNYVDEWLKKAEPMIEQGILTYVPKLSQAQLRNLYEQAKIMVFPSNYEIFGMVLLEAMYFDLPVISSDNGGSDMLIRDRENGLIEKEFNVDKWAKRIIEMHDDYDKYSDIKNNLCDKDKSIYTWDGIARKYLNAVESRRLV